MFDTMTMTKTLGAMCGTLLVFLLGNWAAESLYHVGTESHGEGEEHQMAYVIETDEGSEGGGGETEEVDFAALMEAADPAGGEKGFSKCKACHKLDGSNGTGPHLDGVFGRDIGSVPDFNYSAILTELPGNWDVEALDGFLADPKGYANGTKMSFAGIKKPEDRADMVAYLESLGG